MAGVVLLMALPLCAVPPLLLYFGLTKGLGVPDGQAAILAILVHLLIGACFLVFHPLLKMKGEPSWYRTLVGLFAWPLVSFFATMMNRQT